MAIIRRRLSAAIALGGAAALALTACTGPAPSGDSSDAGSAEGGDTAAAIVYGTTDKVTSLDPAGSYDNGSFMLMNQVYPLLLNSAPGTAEVEPDLAESAEFTSENEYTVTLPGGLTWANGNTLDSADVKFTFDRQLEIADPNGPSSLLGNLESVEAPDPTTVVFTLKEGNDQTFPQVLSSPVGPIVDDETFPPDGLLSDEEIVAADAFHGQYTIDSYEKNQLVNLVPFDGYDGLLGPAKNGQASIKYYADSNNLKLDIEQGTIDVASRALTPTDVEDLSGNDDVVVHEGPGGELRYVVFNFDTMPFGAETEDADEDKALAVRQSMADLVDRDALSEQVYKGTYTPAYGYVPKEFEGATEPLKVKYGDGDGAPDADRAAQRLEEAGVETPVTLNLQYNPDHYGPSSGEEYALVKQQLEADGLFTVNLQSTEWVTYQEDRVDSYPVYQLGWYPDYSDADNYLSPFFAVENFLSNNYVNEDVDRLIAEQRVTPDEAERSAKLGEIQDLVGEDLSTLPLLQGAQVAVSGTDVTGVDDTLDPSFKFRLGAVSKEG
ncbi:ABC transporter substrate-binding protein [Citricoccus nitrophenolicus]|uniref:ABC transporter substrate-binding protein n=1 Tax=Citricoccus nitrophenolicus TaxID=863575 RepID=A0ABV0ILG2_9MICC|nr:ABC transporter substrate-binding protein [Citricoccus sp. I39-566]WMY77739.1 ABC transporter substrate-binding protein [Citricoccus sp. I39-566]